MLYVITGPPAAGKTTWVGQHAQPGDIVIDYDHIAQTLGSPEHYDHPAHIKTVALAARRAAIDAALPLAEQHDVYLIHSQPNDTQLATYRAHDARMVTIDPGKAEVMARIDADRPWQLRKAANDWYTPTEGATTTDKPKRLARPLKTTERGYGARHTRLRKRYEPTVRAGQATCWRCGQPIKAEEPWDLGHDDDDRTQYRGPEHVACNRGAPGRRRASGGIDNSRRW